MKSDITIILLLYKTPLRLIKNFKVFKDFNVIVLDQSNDREFKKKLLVMFINISKTKIPSSFIGIEAHIIHAMPIIHYTITTGI